MTHVLAVRRVYSFGCWSHDAGHLCTYVMGFVIANDVDMKRCNLLTHQTKRANSPGYYSTLNSKP